MGKKKTGKVSGLNKHGTRYAATKKGCRCEECAPIAKAIQKQAYEKRKAKKLEEKAKAAATPPVEIPKAQVIHPVPEEAPPADRITPEAIAEAMATHDQLEAQKPTGVELGIKAALNPAKPEDAVIKPDDPAPPLAARERGGGRKLPEKKPSKPRNPVIPSGALMNTQARGGILPGVEQR